MPGGNAKTSSALIYDPYFAALGGGELYASLLALELADDNMVSFLAPVGDARNKVADRFGLDLGQITWLSGRGGLHEASRLSRNYRYFICLTLTDPPLNQSPAGILVVQFPYGPPPPKAVLTSYHLILCYSQYCQEWIKRRWGIEALVLNPATPEFVPPAVRKRNLIVSIGRLQPGLNEKCFPALMRSFSVLIRDKMAGWEYYVIGGTGQSHCDRLYLAELSRLAAESGAVLVPDPTRQQLLNHLGAAKIYWHGTGYGHPGRPESLEHFGISIVEALASSAIPLVYGAGGPVEIVENGVSGFYWNSPIQLQRLTLRLAQDTHLLHEMAGKGPKAAARFSQEKMRSQFRQLLGRIYS